MIVTQTEIDNSLVLASSTYLNVSRDMMSHISNGCEPSCKDKDLIKQLSASIFLLEGGLNAVSRGCVTIKDLWITIQVVNTISNC